MWAGMGPQADEHREEKERDLTYMASQEHKEASGPLTSSQRLPQFDHAHVIRKLYTTSYPFPA